MGVAVFEINYFTGLASHPLAIFGYIVLGLFFVDALHGYSFKIYLGAFLFQVQPFNCKMGR